ncbi:MAG: 7-cyano-7-deazaguanine synthase [Actinomycetota bacterium]
MSGGRNLVLLSAGLDSAVNLLMAMEHGGVDVAVTVDYGQRAARREVERSRALCETYGVDNLVLDATWLAEVGGGALTSPQADLPGVEPEQLADPVQAHENMKAVWVPNRNGLLVNMGACVAESRGLRWVIMGLNAEEGAAFPDNTAAFVRETNRALGYSTLSRVRVRSFTVGWDKLAIMREAIRRELDFRYVWSCYNGEEKMCGSCESCVRLLAAASLLRVTGRLERLFSRMP